MITIAVYTRAGVQFLANLPNEAQAIRLVGRWNQPRKPDSQEAVALYYRDPADGSESVAYVLLVEIAGIQHPVEGGNRDKPDSSDSPQHLP